MKTSNDRIMNRLHQIECYVKGAKDALAQHNPYANDMMNQLLTQLISLQDEIENDYFED